MMICACGHGQSSHDLRVGTFPCLYSECGCVALRMTGGGGDGGVSYTSTGGGGAAAQPPPLADPWMMTADELRGAIYRSAPVIKPPPAGEGPSRTHPGARDTVPVDDYPPLPGDPPPSRQEFIKRPAPTIIPPPWTGTMDELRDAIKRSPIKDSGERVKHATGAVRDSAKGRGRYDLISPVMMDRLAKHLEAGAAKYEDRNWEKGLPLARMFASLFRHSWQAFCREDDEDHLAAVVCNAMFIMHTAEMIARGRLPESLDDLPDYRDAMYLKEEAFTPIPDGEEKP